MPNIRTYIPSPITLRPDEKGYAAFETAGRRIGPLYNQAGQDYAQIGASKARTLKNTEWPFAIADLTNVLAKQAGVSFKVEGGGDRGGSGGTGSRGRSGGGGHMFTGGGGSGGSGGGAGKPGADRNTNEAGVDVLRGGSGQVRTDVGQAAPFAAMMARGLFTAPKRADGRPDDNPEDAAQVERQVEASRAIQGETENPTPSAGTPDSMTFEEDLNAMRPPIPEPPPIPDNSPGLIDRAINGIKSLFSGSDDATPPDEAGYSDYEGPF